MKSPALRVTSSPNTAYPFLIVFLGFIIYANILNSPFQFDDWNFIVGNPEVKDIFLLLTTGGDSAVDQRKILTFLTFALNYHFGQENTFGYHLVNVILHIAAAAVLFYVIRFLFNLPALVNSPLKKDRDIFAFFTALIFLTHPLQTQSVTYIWERSEVLSALFYLVSYGFYLLGRVRRNKGWYYGAVFTFYIGFFAKGTIVTLPLLVILTELSFLNLSSKKKNFIAGTVLAAAAALLFLWYAGILGDIFKIFRLSSLLRDPAPHFYTQYFFTEFRATVLYLRLCFLPINQNLDYDFRFANSFFEWETCLAFLSLTGIIVFALFLLKKEKLMAFGIFWFFIYLLPTTSGMVLLEPVQEHRLYLSVAGFAIFLAAVIFKIVRQPRARTAVLTGIVIALSLLTVLRNSVWTSREKLMRDTISKSPCNARPYFVLGSIYFQQDRWPEAAQLYHQAIALNPLYPDPHNNLGLIYIKLKDYKKAEQEFETAMRLDPNFVHAYINLGYLASLQKKFREAEKYFLHSLDMSHSFTLGLDKAAVMLAAIYLEENRLAEAREVLNKAIALNPYNEKAYFGLGTIAVLENNYPNALAMYKKVIEINPVLFEGYMQVGVAYYLLRNYERAIEFYEQALKIDSKRRAEIYPKLNDIYKRVPSIRKIDGNQGK